MIRAMFCISKFENGLKMSQTENDSFPQGKLEYVLSVALRFQYFT